MCCYDEIICCSVSYFSKLIVRETRKIFRYLSCSNLKYPPTKMIHKLVNDSKRQVSTQANNYYMKLQAFILFLQSKATVINCLQLRISISADVKYFRQCKNMCSKFATRLINN